jgi:glycosyltransferase involved in cell wall biosynthesis
MSQTVPKITVITPSYNQENYIEQTILSVLKQNYPNLEYFIIDGGSTDNSVNIIKKYSNQITWWISEKDNGQSHAINKGLQRASGDFVVWLNSDDTFEPKALRLIGDIAAAHPDAGLIIGNGSIIDKEGRYIRRYSKTTAFDYNILLKGSNYILQPSTFINKSVLEKEGTLDESLHYAMDLDYWLRVGNKYQIVTVDTELSAYRWYDDIKTASGGIKRWIEMWQILQRHSSLEMSPGLLLEFFKSLQEPKVSKTLEFSGIDIFSKNTFWHLYKQMQSILKTNDCIPIHNTATIYNDTSNSLPNFLTVSEKPLSSSISQHEILDTIPKLNTPEPKISDNFTVDVVLPIGHSWFVREGYVEALRKIGVLGKVFYISSWSNQEDDAQLLFEHLPNCKSNAIFLLDTLWHSQQLHCQPNWRKRWQQCKSEKIFFSFECMSNPFINSTQKWKADCVNAVRNAAACASKIIYSHEIDEPLFMSLGVPCLFQPFAIDPNILPPLKSFENRLSRAFFKGKSDKFYNDENCYLLRRKLINHLRHINGTVDVFDNYNTTEGTSLIRAQNFLREMGEYKIVIGLPSLSPTMVVRPFEALLSGCVFLQDMVQGDRTRNLFTDYHHLVWYDPNNPLDLTHKITHLLNNEDLAKEIAINGHKEVLKNHTINKRIEKIFEWLKKYDEFNNIISKSKKDDLGKPKLKTIVIDGVIFFMQNGSNHGISRVWKCLLEQLAKSDLAQDIVLFDRNGTAPRIDGIRRKLVSDFDYQRFESDPLWVDKWCKEENADLFISTYHTWAETTPSMIMIHDMIPEVNGFDLQQPEWRAKSQAISKSIGFLSVSNSTSKDLIKFHRSIDPKKIIHTPNAVGDEIHWVNNKTTLVFRNKFNLYKNYFIVVGNRSHYKNVALFSKAFSRLPNRQDLEILFVGGAAKLELELQSLLEGLNWKLVRLSDSDLSAAYSSAVALVYPSKYEGFGLPILEAQKCRCPVITCRNSSLEEVAGLGALYVDDNCVSEMIDALMRVQTPSIRDSLKNAGSVNVQRFSWQETAKTIGNALKDFRTTANSFCIEKHWGNHTTIRRLIYFLDQRPDLYFNLSKNLRIVLWQLEGFEIYNRARLEAAEIDVAYLLDLAWNNVSCYLAQIDKMETLLAFIVGLRFDKIGDSAAAYFYYLRAWEQKSSGVMRFRITKRLLAAAERSGNIELAESVRRQMAAEWNSSVFGGLNPKTETKAVFDVQLDTNNYRSSRVNKSENIQNQPLVSAIVSTYNSERFIRGCLEDLEAQTIAQSLEIIVVDSNSQENEKQIVEEFQSRFANIVYIRTDIKETVYGAWNRGIRAARGKYITNANTDDRHREDAFEILAARLDTNSDVSLVYANCLITTHENERFYTSNPTGCFHWLDFSAINLLTKGCFIGPQPMWRREVHSEHGFFDSNMVTAGDYEFWLRISQNRKLLHIPDTLGLYLKSPTSIEHSNREAAYIETTLAIKRYSNTILNNLPPYCPTSCQP